MPSSGLIVTDIQKLRDFADKMEYEGGFIEMVNYGLTDTGDAQLNDLLRKLGDALVDVESHWAELNVKYNLDEYDWEEEDEE